MNRSIKLWSLWGFAVVSLGGTLLHYLYDFTVKNKTAALFSGVNESTWEHMKLLFFPMLFFGIVQSFFFRDRQDFVCIKLKGILLGLILIPVMFYTYNGAFGKSPHFFNIGIFFASAAAVYFYEWKKFKENPRKRCPRLPAVVVIAIITAAFLVFTFYPPEIPLFMDPLTNSYGIL